MTASQRSRASVARRIGLVLVALVLLAVTAVGITYRRQIVSYLSHRKGGPTTTWPYVAEQPTAELHLAVAGDVGDSGDGSTPPVPRRWPRRRRGAL
jgi:hypothetical protein